MTLPAHHDGSYVDNDAPALGDVVNVFLRAPSSVSHVDVRVVADGEPGFVAAVMDKTEPGGEVWWRAAVPVRNPVTRYRFLLRGGARVWLNGQGIYGRDVPDACDFRLVAHQPPPAWARDAIVYQIFPDRFARSALAQTHTPPDWAVPCDWDTPVIGSGEQTPRQFYGGDLDGITEHLDHVGDLGANTVYLTPVFPARSNHRYDASAFDRVDPLLGGDAALGRLAAALHERGARLLGDLTTNHCGAAHPWVREPELFYRRPGGGYETWLGVQSLPKLNWNSPALRRLFLGGPDAIATRWLSMLDGWRVDVANMTGRRGADDLTAEVAALLRDAVVGARPDALLIAEHCHDGTADLDRDGWHGSMNYAGFTRPLWTWLSDTELPTFLGVPGGVPRLDGADVVATMRAFNALVSWRSYTHSWTLLGSHDTPRVRTVVGSAALQEVAAGLLLTMPGTPMIFAGDELGLRGDNGEHSRTPMPWRRPERWDQATLGRYRELIRLRRDQPALRHGGLRWVHVDPDTIVFLRETWPATGAALMVMARRAPGAPISLAGFGPAANLYGGAEASTADGALRLPGDGPTFQVWSLGPGSR